MTYKHMQTIYIQTFKLTFSHTFIHMYESMGIVKGTNVTNNEMYSMDEYEMINSMK